MGRHTETATTSSSHYVKVNLDDRWEALRTWLRDVAHDTERSGRIDETDVLLKMHDIEGKVKRTND